LTVPTDGSLELLLETALRAADDYKLLGEAIVQLRKGKFVGGEELADALMRVLEDRANEVLLNLKDIRI
jgi:hypothetical protein